MSESGIRGALHRRAQQICILLGKGWMFVIEVRAGGKSSRVVFANGSKRERIVLSEDGRLAAISSTDKALGRRVARVVAGRTKGRA